MTVKEDDVLSRFEAVLAAKEAELEAARKKETVVGTVMKNGGGAVTGGTVGWYIGAGIGAALAPFTAGVSLGAGPIVGAAIGGGIGHKMSKDID